MKWVFAAFLLSMALVGVGLTILDNRSGSQDSAVRTIHYDTKYDLSAQRRTTGESR